MFRNLLIFVAPFLLAIPASSAGLLTFSLDQSVMGSPPGGIFYSDGPCLNQNGDAFHCVIFSGTIAFTDDQDYFLTGMQIAMDPANPDGGADVFDNTFNSGSNGNDYFLNNVPALLGPDNPNTPPNSFSGGLFEVDVAANTPSGAYFGTATLDYSDSMGNNFTSSPVNFEVVVPEPGMFPLALMGLAAMAGYRRKKARA